MACLRRTILASAFLLLSCLSATAQTQEFVAIYELNFSEPDPGAVNYSYYTGGFLIVPGNNGTASFVLTLEEDGEKVYAIAQDSAEVFFVSDGDNTAAVARARSDRDTAQSSLLLTGKPDRDLYRPKSNLRVASKLKGKFLASDSESGEAFDPDEGIGFVGISDVQLRFSSSRSDLANYTSKTVAESIESLERELTFRGFQNEVIEEEVTTEDTTTTTVDNGTATTLTDSSL